MPPLVEIDQEILILPSFTLECGETLREVPVAYKTWGELNEKRDNVMIICHAFTGSSDVEDWCVSCRIFAGFFHPLISFFPPPSSYRNFRFAYHYGCCSVDRWGPLMGPSKAFDPNRFFILCANVAGSPYGTVSPVSINPDSGEPYGPSFPPTSIRDDILCVPYLHVWYNQQLTVVTASTCPRKRLHKRVLDHLGITSVAVVIGGSMGGMTVLEWPLCTPPGFVRHIIPIATSAQHSAWCISWGETQRQCVYSDPGYEDGYYKVQPASGLAAARMVALLTYRSRDSFESRFGRKGQVEKKKFEKGGGATATMTNTANGNGNMTASILVNPPGSPDLGKTDPLALHNDGNRNRPASSTSSSRHQAQQNGTNLTPSDPTPASATATAAENARPPIFSAQSYLRYQGDKFVARFDANCYIHLTRKLDTHDIARGRRPVEADDASRSEERNGGQSEKQKEEALVEVLRTLPPRALVIGIETDGLFTPSEQTLIANHVPDAELVIVPSPEGHDGFLLEFELINGHVLRFLKREFPEYYAQREGVAEAEPKDGFEVKKTSMFGEAEVDITHW
jgi:homoserine O-acetyltransferase/O-succinyltransferase